MTGQRSATAWGRKQAGAVRCPEPCGHVRHLTRAAARNAAARYEGLGLAKAKLRPFRCQSSDFWHLTSVGTRTTETLRTRDAGKQKQGCPKGYLTIQAAAARLTPSHRGVRRCAYCPRYHLTPYVSEDPAGVLVLVQLSPKMLARRARLAGEGD